jgi:hypothetical protein
MDRTLNLRHGKLEEIGRMAVEAKTKKKVRCPGCGNEIIVEGTPGERINITCEKCHLAGVFNFPKDT